MNRRAVAGVVATLATGVVLAFGSDASAAQLPEALGTSPHSSDVRIAQETVNFANTSYDLQLVQPVPNDRLIQSTTLTLRPDNSAKLGNPLVFVSFAPPGTSLPVETVVPRDPLFPCEWRARFGDSVRVVCTYVRPHTRIENHTPAILLLIEMTKINNEFDGTFRMQATDVSTPVVGVVRGTLRNGTP